MENHELPYKINEKYSHELCDIYNILSQLKNNRVYDITNCQSDGFLSTHIDKLEKELNSLLNKIQYGKDSIEDLFFQVK
ncbi:hypothetical protein [Clostridium perfringens]|uniref:hypothetical protein n=1 Tax=Clostridium perfringens TaxID=1502 RepID=UPI001E64E5AF|nr:hypothetical protein [Clostridium perfringens]MCC5421382.1 hypothetical protein [Clostridium perfringens]MCC5430812.1 hypothetical protein [Clostridium perfringens]MCC5445312.1 hypothetical protein [Clostridium perfringens]MCC5448259.1 hypothetical protein [Clostridium perfringens]MDG6891181.1 hypothetical protein [Clostridium perfringens]